MVTRDIGSQTEANQAPSIVKLSFDDNTLVVIFLSPSVTFFPVSPAYEFSYQFGSLLLSLGFSRLLGHILGVPLLELLDSTHFHFVLFKN
jgi:hypothetical protein